MIHQSQMGASNGVFIVTGMTNGTFAKLGCAGCPERAECARQVRTRLAGASGPPDRMQRCFLAPERFQGKARQSSCATANRTAKASQGLAST
jgi:hypothetical protein